MLHHEPRPELLAIVELAAKVCATPMATVNLITADEQHQVATFGFDASICRREDSMCALTLDDTAPVVVPDASIDERFRDNPFVTGVIGSVRFYASQRLRTPDGTVIGTLCVFDVSRRDFDPAQVRALATLAERVVEVLELSLRSHQLSVSNERLAAFAGRVSHDLKRPLTTVSMSLGLLREQLAGPSVGAGRVTTVDAPAASAPSPDELRWLVERALAGSGRMAELIDHILDYARLGGSLRAEPVDLERTLFDVLTDLDGVLDDVTVLVDPLPTVLGDPVQFRQLLQNLIDNCVKYRAADRALSIHVMADARDEVWRVCVADTGRGIAAADQARIFEPLVRLDDDDRGSGIGLDTCRRIVEAHGGWIGAEDTPGGGTTVWFELPAV